MTDTITPDATATGANAPPQPTFIAFASGRMIAEGDLAHVARKAKIATDMGEPRAVQVFDAVTSEPWDLDLSGTLEEVLARHRVRLPRAIAPRPGRPKLGVVAREVTLLPRHWAWLNEQPGGASAAIRRLVEDARKSKAPQDVVRRATTSVYRFLLATLGDAPGFEEAMRALYAGDESQFVAHGAGWPADLRRHALALAHHVFHPGQG